MDMLHTSVYLTEDILQLTELTTSEKLYLAIYRQFKRGTKEFNWWIESAGWSKSTIKRIEQKLESRGFIDVQKHISDPYIAKKMTIELSHTGKICEWCERESYVLHEHHFPIPKSEGGTDTVYICPNCHNTYHSILLRGE